MPEGKQEMVWSVTTHEHRARSVDWYWALGVVALLGAIASVFFGNGLLAIIIVLGAASIGYLAARGPREHTVKIDDRGVSVDGTRYPYSAIRSFWVEHEATEPHLFLSMRGVLTPHISLLLDDARQGEAVRAHLLKHIEEEEQGPHIGEHLAEIFGL
ncbi:MAG: Uncharacterized protein G01um101456_533 [Parcubacteria group bacterium Gr01-1014_56]|nr:MAG: Uncharacterized protein G01um101456_533 [Parcubacteria group bacterium Gr01-1014_56]